MMFRVMVRMGSERKWELDNLYLIPLSTYETIKIEITLVLENAIAQHHGKQLSSKSEQMISN